MQQEARGSLATRSTQSALRIPNLPTTITSRIRLVALDLAEPPQDRPLLAKTIFDYPKGRLSHVLVALILVAWAIYPATASPLIPAGDTQLRHDIQVLADRGILSGPVTSWPLAWGPILAEIENIDPSEFMHADARASLVRVRSRASRETRTGELIFSTHASMANAPMRIRSFQSTPRERGELGSGFSWTGDRLSIVLQGQYVDPESGSSGVQADGSMIGVALGNWSLSANTLERWWGPGWDGSLILSNNARAIPAVSLDRNFTDAFENKWLSWIGPWDFSVMMGELESDRAIPNALFFGMRFNFKPIRSLEIGLVRSAQWCGDGRPCDAGTFGKLLIGRDNLGDAGIERQNEPGNQLAGVDLRWFSSWFNRPLALYGQFIGEDEAGGFPSRFIGQVGMETSGLWRDSWTWHWFGEISSTSCQFYKSSELFNCAYNHSIYRTGYRYRGRSIGHGADNDARLLSSGVTLVGSDETEWRAMLRYGRLNRGPKPDVRNTVTPVSQDIVSVDLAYRRVVSIGVVEAGAGVEYTDGETSNGNLDTRFYLQWRSTY